MALQDVIYKLRNEAHMSREQFAQVMGVSQQAVQKWENGNTVPDMKNVVKMAKFFHVSTDALLLDGDLRSAELNNNKTIAPNYSDMVSASFSDELTIEYTQSYEEGLDVEQYKNLFEAVDKMPKGANRDKMADVLFDIVINAPMRADYPYTEPSALEEIRQLRKEHPVCGTVPTGDALRSRIHGAWLGRVIGCLLGKPVEGIRTNDFIPLLKETGNMPMHRYILSADITDKVREMIRFDTRNKCFADTVNCMPVDDDTNYVVLAQLLIDRFGSQFAPKNVARLWLESQSIHSYFTAERVAFVNFINGYEPPVSAVYKNHYREYIGAQIRGDYFGYINPGQPERAAELAFKDACISHSKNGIYGEMFVSAMISCAAVTDDMEDIIRGGLAQIPQTSRLYEAVDGIIQDYKAGKTLQDAYRKIHAAYDEHTGYGWCHTISNAMIVTAALLYGEGDFGKSICMAVEAAFDTDCNGATVGSIIGMRNGVECISEYWAKPVNNTIDTSIFGVGKVSVMDCVEKTLQHIAQNR